MYNITLNLDQFNSHNISKDISNGVNFDSGINIKNDLNKQDISINLENEFIKYKKIYIPNLDELREDRNKKENFITQEEIEGSNNSVLSYNSKNKLKENSKNYIDIVLNQSNYDISYNNSNNSSKIDYHNTSFNKRINYFNMNDDFDFEQNEIKNKILTKNDLINSREFKKLPKKVLINKTQIENNSFKKPSIQVNTDDLNLYKKSNNICIIQKTTV
jgi:hypothetical protein